MKRERTYLYISLIIFSLTLVLILSSLAWSASIRLIWDHEGAEGYRLYLSEFSQPPIQVWQGPERTKDLDLIPGTQYWCYVTAFNGQLESAPSDILQFTVPTEQQTFVVPGRPSAIRIEFFP